MAYQSTAKNLPSNSTCGKQLRVSVKSLFGRTQHHGKSEDYIRILENHNL